MIMMKEEFHYKPLACAAVGCRREGERTVELPSEKEETCINRVTDQATTGRRTGLELFAVSK